MGTPLATDSIFADVEALLDRLDPAAHAACVVPGCVHHVGRHHEATWVGGVRVA